jgi:RNA polymerase sigma-70 factor (ECF subfamily)
MAADVLPRDDEVRQLVVRCLNDDQAAVAELVARYNHQVFGLCYRMLGQRQDAEDVSQESFVRAIRGLGGWDSRRDFAPWLLAIAGNRCRTMLAARRRRPRATSAVEELADARPEVEPARNLAEEVDRALAGLRAEYRQAFVLFHEQQLSYAQIAQTMDCPLGTVKTWVHRARRELVEQLRQRGVVQEHGGALRRV